VKLLPPPDRGHLLLVPLGQLKMSVNPICPPPCLYESPTLTAASQFPSPLLDSSGRTSLGDAPKARPERARNVNNSPTGETFKGLEALFFFAGLGLGLGEGILFVVVLLHDILNWQSPNGCKIVSHEVHSAFRLYYLVQLFRANILEILVQCFPTPIYM